MITGCSSRPGCPSRGLEFRAPGQGATRCTASRPGSEDAWKLRDIGDPRGGISGPPGIGEANQLTSWGYFRGAWTSLGWQASCRSGSQSFRSGEPPMIVFSLNVVVPPTRRADLLKSLGGLLEPTRVHGESVLARLHFEGRLAAAGVVGHAQVVEDQADVARQALDGRGDGIAGLGFDGTDGEAA